MKKSRSPTVKNVRPGRPELPEEQRLSEQAFTLLTPRERKLLDTLARERDEAGSPTYGSRAAILRTAFLDWAKRRRLLVRMVG